LRFSLGAVCFTENVIISNIPIFILLTTLYSYIIAVKLFLAEFHNRQIKELVLLKSISKTMFIVLVRHFCIKAKLRIFKKYKLSNNKLK
jgi:hypothetical protein